MSGPPARGSRQLCRCQCCCCWEGPLGGCSVLPIMTATHLEAPNPSPSALTASTAAQPAPLLHSTLLLPAPQSQPTLASPGPGLHASHLLRTCIVEAEPQPRFPCRETLTAAKTGLAAPALRALHSLLSVQSFRLLQRWPWSEILAPPQPLTSCYHLRSPGSTSTHYLRFPQDAKLPTPCASWHLLQSHFPSG